VTLSSSSTPRKNTNSWEVLQTSVDSSSTREYWLKHCALPTISVTLLSFLFPYS
jgi:hypothetical protein